MEDSNKYYRSRHFQKLLRRYEKALEEGRVPYMEADELTDIAEYYMTGNQDTLANRAIQAAIRMHPDSVDPQIFLARQKMFYGQLDEARAILDALDDQDDLEVIYVQAEILIKEGKVDEAEEFLYNKMEEKCQRKEIDDEEMESYYHDCVSIFMDYNQWEAAETWLKQLKDQYPGHPRLDIMEAEIQMGLDNYEDAMPMLQDILDTEPYNSEAWNLLAETHNALEMYAEAVEDADYALAINPSDANAILMKANAYSFQGMSTEATENYENYLKLQPEDLSVSISLALCHINENRYQQALNVLQNAEHYAPRQTEKKQELAQICILEALSLGRIGKKQDAIRCMEKAWEHCEEEQAWQCYMTEADIYLQSHQPKEAEKYFSQALQKCPDRSEILFNIAIAYSSAGYYDVAIELLEDVWTIFGTEEGKFVVPYLADCYLHKFRQEPDHSKARDHDIKCFLLYLKLAPMCDREATIHLFRERFPTLKPEDYYAYAHKEIYGTFPEDHVY